jgi:hypothetical protein
VDEHLCGLRDERASQPIRQHVSTAEIAGQEWLVVFGQHADEVGAERQVAVGAGDDAGGTHPLVVDHVERDDAPRQLVCDLDADALDVGAAAVDLVDVEERRDAQALERAHQDSRLRLDALDRRDDQDRPVEHAQDTLDLGDEVGMARRVDEVDGHVVDRERDDGGADGDAALLLECERVGLRRARVDAADGVDDTGGVQQPFC